jgi:hypothetical protein
VASQPQGIALNDSRLSAHRHLGEVAGAEMVKGQKRAFVQFLYKI